ncbi:MAG: hypothetical protein GXY34_15385 [Syntrophomonadaceae bacterium]|nr:hypothetical protein [Syntrophomonadaceae bacterium]
MMRRISGAVITGSSGHGVPARSRAVAPSRSVNCACRNISSASAVLAVWLLPAPSKPATGGSLTLE